MPEQTRLLRRAAAQARQARAFGREFADPRRLRRQWAATRGLHGPFPRRAPRAPGQVWGVSMVKDEVDVLDAVLDHLLDQGVDRLLVADNGSTDGTLESLRERAARDPRLTVVVDREVGYYQSEKMSNLARVAWWAGADWVVPFDADELWFARGRSLAEELRASSAQRVYAAFHLAVPTEAHPVPLRDAELVLDGTPAFPGKVAFRSHPLAMLTPGNHDVSRVGAGSPGLFVAHLAYRGPDQIRRKVRQGMAAHGAVAHHLPGQEVGGHWVLGAGLEDEVVEDVWRAISAGRPDARMDVAAHGPMVRAQVLRWPTWDPEGVLPTDREARRHL